MSREPIRMPALSDTMETGRLVSWLKQPGDAVKKGEAIAEVESDKAIMELEAFRDGYLAGPLAEPDSELPVGAVLGYLSDAPETTDDTMENAPEGRAAASSPPPQGQPERPAGDLPAAAPPAREPALPPRPAARNRQGVRASPWARALARDLGLELKQIPPGPDGTVRSAQVVAAALGGVMPDLASAPPWHMEPLTPMQRTVARGMQATASTPMFRVTARLPIEPLRQAAQRQKKSLTLLLARACALTIERHPRFNAVYTPQGLALRQRVDVGIAVDLEDGLVTPVLRDVAQAPLEELAAQWQALKERTIERRLQPKDYSGATFYLSNLGVFDVVEQFDAIVPRDAAAILAVATERNGMARCTLTCDHRVLYGADAARFLETLAQVLQSEFG